LSQRDEGRQVAGRARPLHAAEHLVDRELEDVARIAQHAARGQQRTHCRARPQFGTCGARLFQPPDLGIGAE
jgi:hypothetical protein